MAFTTSCCLNLPSPSPTASNTITSSKTTTTTTQLSWQRNSEKWRKQCVVGMACVMMGVLQIGSIEESSGAAIKPNLVVESKEKIPKWSDKRKCPPWHVNSLETIVPENLPRPSARRRWETVKNNAPVIQLTVKTGANSCFSL